MKCGRIGFICICCDRAWAGIRGRPFCAAAPSCSQRSMRRIVASVEAAAAAMGRSAGFEGTETREALALRLQADPSRDRLRKAAGGIGVPFKLPPGRGSLEVCEPIIDEIHACVQEAARCLGDDGIGQATFHGRGLAWGTLPSKDYDRA